MKTKLFSKILGVGLAIGLVFALGAAIIPAGEAQAGEMEWGTVTTPSETDFVIAQDTDILDYAVGGEDGSTVYALVNANSSVAFHSSINGTAGWSTAQVHDGSYSAKLHVPTAGTDWGRVDLYMPCSTVTLENFTDNPTFWAYGAGEGPDDDTSIWESAPYLNILLDNNGDGTYDTGLEGVVSSPLDGGDPSGDWQEMSSPTYYKTGHTSDSVNETNTRTLADWNADTTVNDYTVVGIMIKLGNCDHTNNVETVYIDDVTIGDATYAMEPSPRVFKSGDAGVTWTDITATVQAASDLPYPFADFQYGGVAIAPDNEDWVAIAGVDAEDNSVVVASNDGGSNFSYTGDMTDAATGTSMATIYDIAVSPEVGGIYNIAVAGISTGGTSTGTAFSAPGTVFRFEAGTWLGGSWVDTTYCDNTAATATTAYPGWDDSTNTTNPTLWTDAVIAVAFSPNFDLDDTVVCLGSTRLRDGAGGAALDGSTQLPYLQEGIWESGGTYNAEAGFSDAVRITNDGSELEFTGETAGLRGMGLALPADFDGTSSSDNNTYLYANAKDTVTLKYGGFVMISEDGALSGRCGPSGDPLLASIAVHGDADTCKAMIGAYAAAFDQASGKITPAGACEGVPVWHTVELDDCCPQWERACKDPSGPYMAMVAYAADGEKAFAATSGNTPAINDGGLGDESAFSVSLDDAVSFNQIGLIDTDIDYLSDMVVCPDCETVYLSTINLTAGDPDCQIFTCDSIWRTWTKDGDIGDVWERVYHGNWTDNAADDNLLLRLPCDELTDCCTVYMGVSGTKNLYYSRDCGQCWNKAVNQKLTIQDFAVESENVVYILDSAGLVSTSTQYGRRPSDGVDTEVGSGHSITSCCDAGMVLVAGASNEPVGYSSDGGETWDLTDDLPGAAGGTAHVACDTACSTDPIIYVATDESTSAVQAGLAGAIYRSNLDDGAWDDLNAINAPYSGIAIGVSDGTLYASSYAIGVDTDSTSAPTICTRFVDSTLADELYSGVARNLDACETDCCGEDSWDYLIAGLATLTPLADEYFDAEPSALRICGCTDIDTPSTLWAIDWEGEYAIADGSDGTLWSYEDCAAKTGPVLTAPADEAIVSCNTCAGCEGAPLSFKWERMCLACSYDIEIMDENGNLIVTILDFPTTGDPPELYWDGTAANGQVSLSCGSTYTWHIREANTSTGECVHSPWSDSWSFTIEASSANAVQLIAPEVGAMGVPQSGAGFSWTSVPEATSYSFVLSANADLSSAMATSDQSGTAYAYSGTLDYEVAYYWQVTAWKDGTMLSQSDIGTFSTAPEEIIVEPPPPAEPPIINIPATQQIVPAWIYAVIGIGAALIVVVIVLIVKSRRPS